MPGLTDYAKTIVSIALVILTAWAAHLNRLSDNLSNEIMAIQINLNTYRVRRDLAPKVEPGVKFTNRQALSKAIRKNTRALRNLENSKWYVESAVDLAVVAISCGAAALAANMVGAIILMISGLSIVFLSVWFYIVAAGYSVLILNLPSRISASLGIS